MQIPSFIENIIHRGTLTPYEAFLVISFIVLVTLLFDWVIRKIFSPYLKKFAEKSSSVWSSSLYNHKVFSSILHFFSIGLAFILTDALVGDQNQPLKDYMYRVLEILLCLVFVRFSFRVVNSFLDISAKEKNYDSVAVKTFGELIKVLTLIIGVLIIISILFDVDFTTIITGLSAITAVLLLVFRDTILGFVAGVQISSSKIIKVGDWITVPKHKADGKVREINLISAKVENFDKTISSIPTYDLISSEVINHEQTKVLKRRRIKRSIVFNLNSIRFCDDDLLASINKIELISDHIESYLKDVEKAETVLNRRNLTNIGIFRKYTERYLLKNDKISNEEVILVRQLEPTPNGLPLEIYCFTKTSDWEEYEHIQADIFDHLLAAAKYFELEVVQINK